MERAERDEDKLRLELDKILRRFTLPDLQEHALREFGPDTLRRANRLVEVSKRRITPPVLAEAIASITKNPDRGQLDNLRLKSLAFSRFAGWRVYQLLDPASEVSNASMKGLGDTIGRSLNIQCRVTLGPLGGDLLGLGSAVRPYVVLLYLPHACLMVKDRSQKPQYVAGIATALGFGEVKDCHLTGRDIPSLLRMLKTRSGERFDAAAVREGSDSPDPPPRYPLRSRMGLNFYTERSREEGKVVKKLGKNPPKLQTMRCTAKVPRPQDEATRGRRSKFSTTRAIIRSADVANDMAVTWLRDMAASGILKDSSIFLKMLERGQNAIQHDHPE